MDLQFSRSASISNLPSLTPSQIPHWPYLFGLISFLLSKHVILARVKGAFNLNTGSVPSCHIQLKMFLNILRHLSMLLERAHKLFFFTGKAHSTRHWGAPSLSRVQLFVTPWTAACQVPLSLGLFRYEYWNGLPFPSPGIFLTQGLNLGLLFRKQTLYHSATWEALQTNCKKHLRVSSKNAYCLQGHSGN